MAFTGWDFTSGNAAIGQGLASIGDAFNTYDQRRQMQALGDQIQTGDLLGAAKTAIARGDLSTGLKLYELHRKTGDEAGLGEALKNILGSTATPALQSGRSAAVVPTAAASLPASFASAVAGGETSATDPGAYGTLGMVIPKTGDQAYGKYQVMGANIRPWTKEILGQEMSPQEFLASPEAQEEVFKGKFGQYASKYGPEGAARAWFAGEGGMNNPNAVDPLGTTVSSYAAGFNRRLGQPPAMQAISTATGGTAPDGTPIDLAASTGEPRRLGPAPTAQPLGQPPPEKDDDPQVQDMISRRNQLIGIMPQARGTKYETMIPAAVQSLNDQIKYLRDRKDKGEDVRSSTAERIRLAPSLGFVPGTPEYQAYTSGVHNLDKTPAHITVKNPDGSETVMMLGPDKKWSPLEVPQPPADPTMPKGVDPKEWMKKKADAAVKEEQAIEESKKTAEMVGPVIDDARAAYEELSKNNAIGPTQALGPVRYVEGVVGNKNEILRQRYEAAIAKLQLLQSRVYMKGQGAVSDFERRLIGATFPSLGAASGKIGLDILDKQKQELERASHRITPAGGIKIERVD
jgi:hypothetical protein